MKIDRKKIYDKYEGHCAYCGETITLEEMQIDHIFPKRMAHYFQSEVMKEFCGLKCNDVNDIENLNPSCKPCNHYKRALKLNQFRDWLLGGLHIRLKKLPKNPKAERSIIRKNYLMVISKKYGITPDKPFKKIFYFEQFKAGQFQEGK